MNADPAPPPIPTRTVKTKSRWADLIPVIIVFAVVGAIALPVVVHNWDSISAASKGVRDGLTGSSAPTNEVGKEGSKSLEEIEHDKRLEEVDKALAARQKAAIDEREARYKADLDKISAEIRRERFAKITEAIKSPFIKLFGRQNGQKRIEDQQAADNERRAQLAFANLERGGRSSGPPTPLRLPDEPAQPNQSAPSNLRDKVLSAVEPEMRSDPDVIKRFRDRAERLKGKIILIGNESLLFTEDTFWEFADALLVKKDTNLATQKATQWVKTGGAILTDEHKYSQGLVKSVDGPFYRFICVESTFQGSKTNFWLSIDNVSRRSPSDFALAINQNQSPFGSGTEQLVSKRVGDTFSCVYHSSDGGLNGYAVYREGDMEESEAAEKADQEEKTSTASSPTPTPKPGTNVPSRSGRTGKFEPGEKVYPSQPVGAVPSHRKTKAELEAYRRRLEQDWDKEVARREKEEAQSDQDKARELYLQKRLGRPPGAHWGIEEDEFWRYVLGLDHE